MSKVGKRIIESAREVEAFLAGRPTPGLVVHIPPEIDAAAIRKRTGLSQARFAASIGVPVTTLRNWEQGRRMPDGPARVLLALIAKRLTIVEEMLGAA